MEIAIVRARIPNHARALATLERKAFSRKEDWATPAYYQQRGVHSFWLLRNGKRIGATCLARNATIAYDGETFSQREHGTLYIISTSILPQYQQCGFGAILKAWQIAYARKHSFKKIVTNARKSNVASIRLNEKFGFTILGCITSFYSDRESAIVLEKHIST